MIYSTVTSARAFFGSRLKERAIAGTDRLERSTNILFDDFKRHGIEGRTIERDQAVQVLGLCDVSVPISVMNSQADAATMTTAAIVPICILGFTRR